MRFTQALICMKKSYEDHVYPYELKESMKEPVDIMEAVEKSKQTGDHSEIHNILKERQIKLSEYF